MNIILLAIAVASLSSGFLSQYAARHSRAPHSKSLAAMLAMLFFWSIAYFLQLLLPGIRMKIIMSNITFLFVPLVPVFWFLFSMQYAGYENYITLKNIWPLLIVPFIVQLGVWSDPFLHWFRDSVALVPAGSFSAIVIDYGHIFWLHTMYSYLLLFLGVFFIIRKVINHPQIPVMQALLLLGACFIPFAVNMMYLFVKGSATDTIDWTPVSLSLSGIMLTSAVFRFKLLEPAPVAYKIVFDSMVEGIIVLNHKGVVIDANPAALKFLNMTPRSVSGMSSDGIPLLRQIMQSLSGGRSSATVSAEDRDGQTKLFEVIIHSFEFELEKENGRLVTIRDITYRKRLEDEVASKQKYESLEMLAGGLAHDFNNLLSIILGNVSLAKEEVTDGSLSATFSDIEKACDRARDLTHQLISFARGEQVHMSDCGIPEIITRVAALFLSGRRIVFDNLISKDLYPVKADEKQLETVFQNLFLNAAEAIGRDGSVSIEGENVEITKGSPDAVMPEGRYVKISLQDSGPGINAEDLPRIYDPYFSTKRSGHGLGLSLAYSIIKRHGGTILAESNQWGARITIYLPAA